MELDPYSFPENTTLKLISTLTDTFTIKTPKISLNRTMKNIKIVKEDGINEPEESKISIIYTPEEQFQKNLFNMNLYKTIPPQTMLVYSDNENDSDELSLLGHPINYDYLLNILQCDLSNIENFIDEKYGLFINKINNNSNFNNKLIYVDEPKNYNEAKIIFDSKFESGNLRMAIKLNSDIPNEYDLIMRKDYNSEKNYSWFYFSIKSDRETDIKFNILNFIKKSIMFDEKNKIRILVYNENDKWTRNTYNVQYYQNNINIFPPGEDKEKIINEEEKDYDKDEDKEDEKDEEKDLDKDNKNKITDKGEKEDIPDTNYFFTLSFCYHVNKENVNIPIYFALCFPYTYTTLQEYLYKISTIKSNKNKIKFSTLNKTICGNPLDILYITNFNCSMSDLNCKQSVIFTARVHPGETSGSYVIESVINSLLDNSQLSKELLDKYVFKIIPMLNPDGVIHGHYRNNILGKDLNRMWQDPRANLTPTIYYLKKLICINKPFFFCDFHGHSNMPNCALYCCSPPKKKKNKFFNYPNASMKSYHFYEEKVFMRIFEEEAKYYEKTGEKYNIQKSKLKSARGVIYNEFNVYFSYALETGIMTKYSKPNINNNFEIILEPSSIDEYTQIGIDYVSSFIKWDVKTKFYYVLKKIREEEELKKIKEKEKEKEKENNGTNNIKETRKENRKKTYKLTRINNGKFNKDILKDKGNIKISKKDKFNDKPLLKEIKEIKLPKIINNSMMILPKLIDGEIKTESPFNKYGINKINFKTKK